MINNQLHATLLRNFKKFNSNIIIFFVYITVDDLLFITKIKAIVMPGTQKAKTREYEQPGLHV